MILSMSYQAQLFLFCVFLGILIGVFYDLIRLFRRIFPHSLMTIQLEDLIYWILSAIFVFLAVLRKNYGDIRPFLILGLFLGVIIYFLLLSPVILKVFIRISGIIGKILILTIKFFYTVLYPLRCILKLFFIPITYMKNKLKKINKNNKIYLKKIQKYAKINIVFLNRCIRIIFRKH